MPTPASSAFATIQVGVLEGARAKLVWGHGWGQSSAAFVPLAESLKAFAPSLLIDFPGFGKSPVPDLSWGTAEYANATALWLRTLNANRHTIWIGHSFGGRVGLQLAARYPESLSGLVLIASAGLPRRRTFQQRLRLGLRRATFRIARKFVRDGPGLDHLRERFGSSDYRNAGAMRPILTRVISEDLTDVAKRVQCPTLLLYGAKDADTPPEIGRRLHALIANSEYVELDNFDHLTILTAGRHQVASRIRRFMEQLAL